MTLATDEIIARNVTFGISKNAKRHWFGDDMYATGIMDCMSIMLPEGERFFITSLKHYLPQITDEEIRNEIRGYTVQEAFHTREHEDYNQSLKDFGYDLDAMEGPARKLLRRKEAPVKKLAATCAIEHLTMTYSLVTLRCPHLLKKAPACYRRMWMWHAVEELEHCNVALHVYHEVTAKWPAWKRYGLRVGALAFIFSQMWRLQTRNMKLYAEADGVKTDLKFWLKLGYATFISPGYITRGLPNLLRYFMPFYKPNPKHYAKELDYGREWIGKELPELSESSEPLPSAA